jgi:hypothetical protein
MPQKNKNITKKKTKTKTILTNRIGTEMKIMWELRLRQWKWRSRSSGMWSRVVWQSLQDNDLYDQDKFPTLMNPRSPSKPINGSYLKSNEFQSIPSSHLHGAQTESGAHQASYPMGTGGNSPRGKAVEAWSWPFTSMQYRGQDWWSYTFTSHTSSWHSA